MTVFGGKPFWGCLKEGKRTGLWYHSRFIATFCDTRQSPPSKEVFVCWRSPFCCITVVFSHGSRGTFPILSRDPSFYNLRKPRANGRFLESTMVEKPEKSTPRNGRPSIGHRCISAGLRRVPICGPPGLLGPQQALAALRTALGEPQPPGPGTSPAE